MQDFRQKSLNEDQNSRFLEVQNFYIKKIKANIFVTLLIAPEQSSSLGLLDLKKFVLTVYCMTN